MRYSNETSIGISHGKRGKLSINGGWFVLCLMICFIIGGFITAQILQSSFDEECNDYKYEILRKDSEIETLKYTVGLLDDADLKDFSEAMSKINPVLVCDIEVRDESTSYGEKIQSKTSTYLSVRVYVASFIEGDYDLYYKLYRPSGKMAKYGKNVDEYVEDYTAMKSMDLHPYEFEYVSFPSIGGDEEGWWSAGTYKIETYFRGRCIGTKEFEIF